MVRVADVNGTRLEFPDETPDDVMDKAVQNYVLGQQQPVEQTQEPQQEESILSQRLGYLGDIGKQLQAGQQEGLRETVEFFGGKPVTFDPWQIEILKDAGDPKDPLQSAARVVGNLFGTPIPGSSVIDDALKATKAGVESTKAFNITKNFMNHVKTKSSDAAKSLLSKTLSMVSGRDEDLYNRLMSKDVKWLPEYKQQGVISNTNRTKAANAFSEAKQYAGQQFDKEVSPILAKSDKIISTEAMADGFLKQLEDSGVIAVEKKMVNGKPKININMGESFTKETDWNNYKRAIENIYSRIASTPKNISAGDAHVLRKRLDDIRYNSILGENPEASKAYKSLRDSIVSQMPDAYRDKNAAFSRIYKLEDDGVIGKKMDRKSVESTLLNLMGKGKSELMNDMKTLDSYLPKEKRFLDDTLDELTVKELSSMKTGELARIVSYGAASGALYGNMNAIPVAILSYLASTPRIQSSIIRGAKTTAPVVSKTAKKIVQETPLQVKRQAAIGLATQSPSNQ